MLSYYNNNNILYRHRYWPCRYPYHYKVMISKIGVQLPTYLN